MALEKALAAAPHLVELATMMLPRMPARPFASQNIRTATPNRWSSHIGLLDAMDCPWCSLDSETHRNALAFDIDHPHGVELAHRLPPHIRPTLVTDPWSGRAHGFLLLRQPLRKDERRAMAAGDAAQRLIAAVLQATALPPGALLKFPWGRVDALAGQQVRRSPKPITSELWEAWSASGTPLLWVVTLGALEPVDPAGIIAALAPHKVESGYALAAPREQKKSIPIRRSAPSPLGRNCSLFDSVRLWAYARAEQDGGAILAKAERVNGSFNEPLPSSEVATIARSITKFMNTRWRPTSGAKRALRRDYLAALNLPAEQRQGFAGRRTAGARSKKTEAKMVAAVESLLAAGKRPIQAAVAAETGLSRRAVQRHWQTVQKEITQLEGVIRSPHQIDEAEFRAVGTSSRSPTAPSASPDRQRADASSGE